jgi:hypothetical protein
VITENYSKRCTLSAWSRYHVHGGISETASIHHKMRFDAWCRARSLRQVYKYLVLGIEELIQPDSQYSSGCFDDVEGVRATTLRELLCISEPTGDAMLRHCCNILCRVTHYCTSCLWLPFRRLSDITILTLWWGRLASARRKVACMKRSATCSISSDNLSSTSPYYWSSPVIDNTWPWQPNVPVMVNDLPTFSSRIF